MMRSGFPNFKPLGADCEVYVRQLSPNRTENRLISNIRKISRTSGGFVVELDYTFQVHTLVEMDVKFPGQSCYYRSRGIVEWHAPSDNPNKPHSLGIRVIGMEKLDPKGTPMSQSKPQRKPALTARVSKRVEPPIVESRADMQDDEISENPSLQENLDIPNKQSADEPPAMLKIPEEREPAADPGADLEKTKIDFAKTQFVPPEKIDPIKSEMLLGEEAAEKAPAEPTYTITLPKAREIAELFTNLVGEEVVVEKAEGDPLDEENVAAIGDFITDDNRVVVLCVMDIKLSNRAAAALAMIPKDVVEMDIDGRKLSDESRENVQEILNIAASVFNKPGTPHLRFDKLIVTMDGNPPAAYKPILSAPTERVDFTVEIPGYGGGIMACMFQTP